MKTYLLFICLLVLLSCQTKTSENMQEKKAYTFYVGTYTDTLSAGIYKYMLKEDGSIEAIGLDAKSENPSYLAKSADKQYLIAVNEIDRENSGSVESFLISGDSLKFISRSSSGGAHPCYVNVNEAGWVLVANYTSGDVGLLRINNDGHLSELLDVQQHTGKGTTERQQGPHAHSAWFEASSNRIIAADLGTNELWFSTIDTVSKKLIPVEPYKIKMEPGAGPRHLAFHPNGKWIYVVNEMGCTVSLLQKTENAKYELDSSFSTLPADYKGSNFCADIHISSDGKFLYASNRGHNSIVIFEVNKADGTLKNIGYQTVRGEWPRNFSLSPDERFILVANQHTNNIVSFKRDSITGLLEYVGQTKAPVPVCILF